MAAPLRPRIDRYEILGQLGQGAMGVVYKARDPWLDRVVAIKTLREDLGLSPDVYAEFRQRFNQEARAAGRLNHPKIIGIYDVKEVGSVPYIVMEYVEGGRSLEDVIRSEAPLPPARAVELIAQVCSALDYAHARGVVHRDIKPSNILVTEAGDVKVSDFGIARIAGRKLTQTGIKLGTPAYMSPEQARGRDVDGRSDLFSVGVVLYEALSGVDAFSGNADAVLYQIVYEPVAPLRQLLGTVPPALDRVVERALAKDPDQRYQTAAAFAAAARNAVAGMAGTASGGRERFVAALLRGRAVLIGAGCAAAALAAALALWPFLWPVAPPGGPVGPQVKQPSVPPKSLPQGKAPEELLRESPPNEPSSKGEGAIPRPGGQALAPPAQRSDPDIPRKDTRPGPDRERLTRPSPAERPGPRPEAESPPPAPQPNAIKQLVLNALVANDLREVEVEVDRALNVDLSGSVPDESSRDKAIRLAQSVQGVRTVRRNLHVVSPSVAAVPPPPELRPPPAPPAPMPSPPPATPPAPVAPVTPALLQQRLESLLRARGLGDITVKVDQAMNVYLGGSAPDPRSIALAVDLVKGVPEVRSLSEGVGAGRMERAGLTSTPAEVEQAVLAALRSSNLAGVRVEVDSKFTVRLKGKVPDEGAKRTASQIALDVPQVKGVINEITISWGQ